MNNNKLAFLKDIIQKAKKAGADAADVLFVEGVSRTVKSHLRKIDYVDQAEAGALGLRVFLGKRQSLVSSTSFSESTITTIVEQAVAMAKVLPEDPYCGIAEPEEIASSIEKLDIFDDSQVPLEQLINYCKEMEDAALSVKGITNSESTGVSFGKNTIFLVSSSGFEGTYSVSSAEAGISVIAGEGNNMKMDWEESRKVYWKDLENPKVIGEKAGERTVKRLGAKKIESGKMPIVLDPRVGSEFLSFFISGINGHNVATGKSFLKTFLNKQVFAKNITIIDDAFMPKGLDSCPFDMEGIKGKKIEFVENGILKTWLLDLSSARQLKMKTTGHAGRSHVGIPHPSPTNTWIAPSKKSVEELLVPIKRGFYVTQTMGHGFNLITGDISLGASGFLIENGKITAPLHEMTIAGNLKELFLHMMVADDLVFNRKINTPTILFEEITVAGL